MTVDWQGWSAWILAISGLIGAVSAVFLNRRGQDQQTIQTKAANDLAERAQGFDEMKEIVGSLRAEISRIEQGRDRDQAAQARRCRSTLDHFVLAFTTLQGQVVSEAAKQAAEAAHVDVEMHLSEDHPPALGEA